MAEALRFSGQYAGLEHARMLALRGLRLLHVPCAVCSQRSVYPWPAVRAAKTSLQCPQPAFPPWVPLERRLGLAPRPLSRGLAGRCRRGT